MRRRLREKQEKRKQGKRICAMFLAGAYGHIWRWECIAGSGREHRGGIGGAPGYRKVGFRSGRWGDV